MNKKNRSAIEVGKIRLERPAPESQGVLAIARALRAIEILAEQDAGMSLSELARRLDINKQIAARITDTLETAGFIFKHPSSAELFLSYRVSNIGVRRLYNGRLLEQSTAILQSLANATGELARLALVEGESLFWVLAAVGRQRTLHINPGYTPSVRLFATATGKAWLSTLSEAQVLSLLARQEHSAFTRNTVMNTDALLAEIAAAKRRGWAMAFEESELGVGGVGAPIFVASLDHGSTCVGTITLAAPTHRMGRDALTEIAPLVLDAARRAGQMWPVFDPMGPAAATATGFRWV